MDEAGRRKLWDSYMRNRTQDIREKIILEYAPLVKVVAGRLSMYLGYNVEYDDLVSYGIFGLIDAIDKFDNKKDVVYKTIKKRKTKPCVQHTTQKMNGKYVDNTQKIENITKNIDEYVNTIV